ncbi:unnamed protein product [Psylliodes chrysocephalus]|uniref:CRAL-TRIO domain-containing protein n=1 Tax=Psylliodes chrysocephalus TaxID=3402493 RepID=A0A9P0D7I2_9CUCU|nr:unnamed protein product [Psylliodes chrysocephala]
MEKIASSVNLLKEWLVQQPHLPKNVPEFFLSKCYIACNNSIEVAKNLIDLFFTLRSRAPDLFANRNLDDPDIQDSFEIFDMIELSETVNDCKVCIVRLNSDNIDKFHCAASVKLFTMFNDLQIFTDDRLCEGEIFIVDLEKSNLKLLTKISLMHIKKVAEYSQEARPLKLKQVHFVNVQPIIEKFLLLIKPFLKAEVINMFNLHQDIETLYKFVPKDVLPKDYGGTDSKTIPEYKKEVEAKLRKYKHVIDDKSYVTVDESKRPIGNPYGDKFGMQGSFRTLDID